MSVRGFITVSKEVVQPRLAHYFKEASERLDVGKLSSAHRRTEASSVFKRFNAAFVATTPPPPPSSRFETGALSQLGHSSGNSSHDSAWINSK